MPFGALDGQEIAQGGLLIPRNLGRAAAGPAQVPDPVPVGALGTAEEPQGLLPAQATAQTPMETANRARPFDA